VVTLRLIQAQIIQRAREDVRGRVRVGGDEIEEGVYVRKRGRHGGVNHT